MASIKRETSLDDQSLGRPSSGKRPVRPAPLDAESNFVSSKARIGRPAAGDWRVPRTQVFERRASALLANYVVIAGAACIALFFVLWWLLHISGDDMPWLPSGLIASIAMIGMVVTREIVVRRAETRSVLHHKMRRKAASEAKQRLGHTAALSAPLISLRTLERHLLELDTRDSPPMQHLEAYHSCEQYLAQIGETLSRTTIEVDVRAALRAGTERIRGLQKRHLLAWARKESQQITAGAQRHASDSEKIKAAERALGVLNEALEIYPGDAELEASAGAVREFAASVHINRWIELAEREVFKGNYVKAIDHYRDALFDLTRTDINEDARLFIAEKITREVQLLHAHQATTEAIDKTATKQARSGDITAEVVTPE